jgi:threonylcarbamoyladenosine tRNA methylthiotransferase MtaB
VRHERTNRLRELSARKNLDFRRSMLNKTLPAVTLEQPGMALTTNFLKVELAHPRQSNQAVMLNIGRVTATALREQEILPCFSV